MLVPAARRGLTKLTAATYEKLVDIAKRHPTAAGRAKILAEATREGLSRTIAQQMADTLIPSPQAEEKR
jgi:hypothetical protein